MKHINELVRNSPSGNVEGGDQMNHNQRAARVECVFASEPSEPLPVPVKRSRSEAFRAEMHRRYTTPFSYTPWPKIAQADRVNAAGKVLKRAFTVIVGISVFTIGLAMIVLPGPAVLMIPAGLAILAVEFAWARRWLRSARAVLPARARTVTVKSVRRSLEFLFRQIRHTVLPKRKFT